jgi:hypothetical protein
MPRGIRIAGLVLGAVALAACAPARGPHADVASLDLRVRFALANLCNGGMSPPIGVDRAPANAGSYVVRITNVTVLLPRPQEWTIPVGVDPARIPYGALKEYAGPCPGEFQRSSYRVEVLALDKDGRRLAYGARTLLVESVNKQAQETWGRGSAPDVLEPPRGNAEFDDVLFRRADDLPSARDRDGGVFSDPRRPPVPEAQPRPLPLPR